MRRWNGWGKESYTYPVPENAFIWLKGVIGEPYRTEDVSLSNLLNDIPPKAVSDHPLISPDPEDRLRHSLACSLPDWIAKRFGRIPRFTEGVAYPKNEDDIKALFQYARNAGVTLIPYGGGTSVVGGIDPEKDGPPSVTVDMSHMSNLISLDKKSHLATFGAGIKGPMIEKLLSPHGLMLGHFPQSYDLSTLGGWIAARSSGQQSLHYGRIEHHFAGGRCVTPVGILEMNPYPASAAGPDLREWIMGSEGRMGFISSAQIRVHRISEHEETHSVFFPTWDSGVDAVREIIQSGIKLSMVRLSNPQETEANLTLAGHERLVALAHSGLGLIGQKRGKKAMLLVCGTGSRRSVKQNLGAAFSIVRKYQGFATGQYMGKAWQKSRFTTPYLRNTLWEKGYAIDTLESIVPWSDVQAATAEIGEAIVKAAVRFGERAYVFTHLSHLYETGSSFYTTTIFRVLPDPDKMLEMWRAMKSAASETIVNHHGSISHQHGIGVDHAPYLQAEKGSLGMDVLKETLRFFDPGGIMNAGKLIR